MPARARWALVLLVFLPALAPLPTLELDGLSPWDPMRLSPLASAAIEISPRGTVLFAGVQGQILAWTPGEDAPHALAALPVRGDSGSTGLALAPDFDDTGRFFVAYVTADPEVPGSDVLRVSRMLGDEETILLETRAGPARNAGRLLVQDDALLVSVGDQGDPAAALDPTREAGKILRMGFDGAPAPGNPAERDPAWDPYVWSLGHHDASGLALEAAEARVVASDLDVHGEEVIVAASGGVEPEPVLRFGEVLRPVGLDAQAGDYYVASYETRELLRIRFEDEAWRMQSLQVHAAPLLDVDVTTDGSWIYYGAWDGLWAMPLRAEAWGAAAAMPPPVAPPPLESVQAPRATPGGGLAALLACVFLAAMARRAT